MACLEELAPPSMLAKAEVLALSALLLQSVLELWEWILHSAGLLGSESCGRHRLQLGLPSPRLM